MAATTFQPTQSAASPNLTGGRVDELRALASGRAATLATLELRAMMSKARWDGDAERDELIARYLAPKRPEILSFVNAHGFNLAAADPAFRRHLLSSDHLLRDGVGMKIGMSLHGLAPGPNLNGTDFIPQILAAAAGRKVAVFGTKDPWLADGAAAISRQGCNVVAKLDGFQDVAAYVEAAKAAQPEIILLAMGMPKQEAVAYALRAALDHPCLIINGGAIVDFMAGRVQRAPALVRRAGMEWAWRLGLEPKRLAKRYLSGNPRFLAHVAALRLSAGR